MAYGGGRFRFRRSDRVKCGAKGKVVWTSCFQMLCGQRGGGESARLHILTAPSAPSQSSLLHASLQLCSSLPWPRFSGLPSRWGKSRVTNIFTGNRVALVWFRERKEKEKQNKNGAWCLNKLSSVSLSRGPSGALGPERETECLKVGEQGTGGYLSRVATDTNVQSVRRIIILFKSTQNKSANIDITCKWQNPALM